MPRLPNNPDGPVPYGKISSPEALGALVRARRQQISITQADAAALAGVGQRFLSELERGKTTCELGKTIQVLQRIGIELTLSPRGGA